MIDVEREIAAARERIHRSIGQRARWAKAAIARRVERERKAMLGPRLLLSQAQAAKSALWRAMLDNLQWGVRTGNHQGRLQAAMMAVDEFENGVAAQHIPMPKNNGDTIKFRRYVLYGGKP